MYEMLCQDEQGALPAAEGERRGGTHHQEHNKTTLR